MFKNYLTIALRNFLRQKGYSFTNVAGLSVGFIAFIFILLWVNDELEFDQFHTDKEKIFMVMDNQLYDDKTYTFKAVPGLLSSELRETVPEIEYAATFNWTADFLCTYNNNSLNERGFYAEPDFFKIFELNVIAGNPNDPLPGKKSIAISEKLAKKYFGNENPIGQSLRIDDTDDLSISVVFEDVPKNSSLQFDLLIPYQKYFDNQAWLKGWASNGVKCMVKLRDPLQQEAVNTKIRYIAKNHVKDAAAEFWLQNYARQRLYSNYDNGREAGGRIAYVKIFSLVAMFVLLIACINFVNLSTARSGGRAKEVGMRKVVGAKRISIIIQFLGESLFVSFLSLLVALLCIYLMLPLFNLLTSKEITNPLGHYPMPLVLLSVMFVTGIIAGIYPAFFLSSFKPSSVLKGQAANSIKGGQLRKILVVIQFSLSTLLIISSIIIYQQIEYIRNKDLGLNRENIVYFRTPASVFKNVDTYKNKILANPDVISVTLGTQLPLDIGNSTSFSNWPGKQPDDQVLIQQIHADYDFLKTFNIQLTEGRDFNGTPSDSSGILLNEEAVSRLNLTRPVVGQVIGYTDTKTYEIIGVMRNFHSESLHSGIEPVYVASDPSWGFTFVKYKSSQTQALLGHLENIHKEYNPIFPFSHTFLSEWYDKQYSAESVTGKLALCFTVTAIFISCLGLLGLASFTVQKKTKEISIRKVMGASVGGLVGMLCRSYISLVTIAVVVGCSIGYYSMTSYLNGYAFHISIGWEAFIATSLLMLVLTFITVAYQSIRAARANPATTLRNE